MADENEGNVPESLTGDEEQGQVASESPPEEDLVGDVLRKATEAKNKENAEEEVKEEKGKEKPAPYDQDPKWKKARAAEARVEKMLEKYGFDNVDELETELDKGKTISQLIGERDAKKLLEDSQTLQTYREYWAGQKKKEQEEQETLEEKNIRQEKELTSIKREAANRERSAMETKALKKALDDYESAVVNIVGQNEFTKEETEMANLLLGVKNPFNTIDISDKAAVKKMAKENSAKFKKFLDNTRQAAIDEYSKGKSKFVPISSTQTMAKESVSKKPIPKNAGVDEVFKMCQDELLESMIKGASA